MLLFITAQNVKGNYSNGIQELFCSATPESKISARLSGEFQQLEAVDGPGENVNQV